MVKPTSSQSPASPTDTSSCSKYRGVRMRKWGKWVSEIRLPNSRERIWLGSYDSAEKAAKAFDAALYCLRGPDANFNFPDNPPEITGGRELIPPEIQLVASRFANQQETGNETTDNNNNNTNTSNNNSSNNESYVGSEQCTYYSLTAVEIEKHEIDWSSFVNISETDQWMPDYGFYSPLRNHFPGDQLYPPPPFDDNVDDDLNGTSQSSSFLWNF
ncbi:hypothetical protein V6N13_106510 [Hibiscus sabdariffa]|uniref:AP2/ERF domain-containing protein n=1 Tax=Hibiscus sabdariffa TaxID=183260 RepID=A0ABR2F0X2_9ROSI